MLSAGCRSNPQASSQNDNLTAPVPEVVKNEDIVRDGAAPAFLPRAVIYRTNGDYDDRVPVTLDATRTSIVSYPAPTDITSASVPLVLADGWLLDRRGGISVNSAFLDWTYAQYAAMSHTPSRSPRDRHPGSPADSHRGTRRHRPRKHHDTQQIVGTRYITVYLS